LNQEYGYQVDLFAAWYNTKLPAFMGPGSSITEDALSIRWGPIRGFANPEYADVGTLMAYALQMCSEDRSFSSWLVPANTDTAWFHNYAKYGQVDFFRGRISFENKTPPEIEAVRLYDIATRRPVYKNYVELARVVARCEKVEATHIQYLEEKLGPKWGEVEEKKDAGPGFPSMLVTFDPDGPVSPPFRTRDSKTGGLL
jgi:hypothetical protein